MFERGADGTIKARLALSEIHAGYELRGERMDNETAAALAAVQSVFEQPELHVELGFELELTRMVRLYGQFDGEFASNARAFAGTGGLRIVW